ncbi:MAG: hypothetical protein F6K22_18360 [Okeania sp. SIO2F4]|uniref:hypothetical protein n=1 Tax=Okeania sp. SIO2F4 TaxID=2607790 RepID=UPI00142B5E0D|nr:hypothetical protein [Okeania sp. SIO2F4]NES04619.1 hypothetical protein [Okeania sp. SIO2F4]
MTCSTTFYPGCPCDTNYQFPDLSSEIGDVSASQQLDCILIDTAGASKSSIPYAGTVDDFVYFPLQSHSGDVIVFLTISAFGVLFKWIFK